MGHESIISFPGLGIDEFIIDRVAISFNIGKFPFTIMWYGIIICIGIFAGFGYFAWRAKQQNLVFDDILDITLVTVITAVCGARLYFVVFYGGYLETSGTFIENVLDTLYNIIAVWNGGLAI
jgi:phosphatidylglycerol:prolipoprotein diacylglycerol transferase